MARPSASARVADKYALDDEGQVRLALSEFPKGLPESARGEVAARIRRAAKRFGIDVSPGSLKASEGRKLDDGAAMIGLTIPVDAEAFAERRVPLLTKGDWHFEDYGDIHFGDAELDEIVRSFREDARRQELPVVNEEHDPYRAVGWITDLEREGDRVFGLYRETDYAEQHGLVDGGAYKYTSPEIWRGYVDSETGQKWPLVLTGLALTNKPRLKSIGPIAASEGVSAGVLAFAEGATSGSPRDASWRARLLMADPDGDGDDDGPVPPCVYQPPYSPIGCCPGYTRRGDADGDGACIFSEKGCNGYRAVSVPDSSSMYSEGTHRMGEPNKSQEPAAQAATPATPAAEPKDVIELRAAFAEQKSAAATLRAELEAERAERVKLSEQMAATERGAKVDAVRARLEACKRDGRISPAEFEAYAESAEKLLVLSEHPFTVEALEARQPGATVMFGERGSGQAPQSGDRERAITERAIAIYDEAAKAGRSIQFSEAAKRAAREVA